MTLNEVLENFKFLNEEQTEKIKNAGFVDGGVDNFSVVEYFIKKGDLEAVTACIENGINVNSSEQGDFGSSLLHIAIRFGKMEVFLYLIEKGADLDFVDKVGWTPLMESVVDDKAEFGKILVEKGCNKGLINMRGASAQALAQKFGRQEFFSFL
jgi:ankyrin repeat protein